MMKLRNRGPIAVGALALCFTDCASSTDGDFLGSGESGGSGGAVCIDGKSTTVSTGGVTTSTGGVTTSTGGVTTSTGGVTTVLPYRASPAAIPGAIQAEDFDNGGEGVAYHDTNTTNSNDAYRATGVGIEPTNDMGGGYDVGWTAAGEWLDYTVNVATAGLYTLQMRVACNGDGGTFHVEFNGTNATGTLTLPNTGGWQTYHTLSVPISLSAGIQVMRLVMDTTGSLGFVGNFNWFNVTTGSVGCGNGIAQSSDVKIDISSLQQKISGFGVSTAWAGDFKDPVNDPDILWSTTKGAGLTLHRIRIGGGSTSETKIAKAAVAYGVKVWATPWEVKASDLSRENCPGTSSCDPPPKLTNPQDWASTLATFVKTMKDAGVPIYAVSAENEPDSNGMNGTTSYTPEEMASWIGRYLGPALANSGTKIMAPETMNWWGFPSYFTAIQNDKAAYDYVSIFASHQYGRGPDDSGNDVVAVNNAIAADCTKEYWQTEVDTGTTSDDPTADHMPSALVLARVIHDDLTKGNLNAFHYWWLYAGGSSGLYDTNTNVWTKRFWIMGNYSRFVRPGYVRVSTSGMEPSGVDVSAYVNPKTSALSIVAINYNTAATDVSFYISANVPCTLTPWETSASQSLGQGSSISVSKSRVKVSLTARSVTTFVGAL